MHRSLAILTLTGALVLQSSALAQDDGNVARSGMGQGEARLQSRSDVRMGIESGPGTSGRRLQAMAEALGDQMGAVRRCYAGVVEERPGITGQMRIRVTLPRARRAGPELRVATDTTDDAALLRCVRRALADGAFRGVERPAIVTVGLDFENSAADGANAVAQRQAEGHAVQISHDAEGAPVAEGGTPEGQVRFTVRGRAGADEALAQTQRTLRASVAVLLDCRRRAGRRGMPPEGEMDLSLGIDRRGRARARSRRSTIQDSRAPTCVTRALGRIRFPADARGRYRLEIRFAPRETIDLPSAAER